MTTVDPSVARPLILALEQHATRGRMRADVDGDPRVLQKVVTAAFEQEPHARVLLDPGARRDLLAMDATVGAILEGYMNASWAREGQLRATLAVQRVPVGRTHENWCGLFRRLRGGDVAGRESALLALATERTLAGAVFDLASASPGVDDVDPTPLDLTEIAALAIDLAVELTGVRPRHFGEWRAAAAGAAVADFRARPIPFLGDRVGVLPFEQPSVPIARAKMALPRQPDAWGTVAQLMSIGHAKGADLGAALALSAGTRRFVELGLEEKSSQLNRARRTLGLSAAAFAVEAEIATRAKRDPARIHALFSSTLGIDVPESVAMLHAAEDGLCRLPGEEQALYAHTPRAAFALTRGAALAFVLREQFDEDWFRNPHLTDDALVQARAAADVGGSRVVAWLVEALEL